jgi:hypothetical protein
MIRSCVPRLLAVAGGLSLLLSTTARATLYGWNYAPGQAGLGTQYFRSDAGGTVQSINTSFDSSTNHLTFDALFSGANGAAGPLVTNGFWLVLDSGPDPKTHSGELAIMYFDATRVFAGTATTPSLTVYGYNGHDADSSWSDGNGDGVPDVSDLIKGAYEGSSFINSISAGDVTLAGQSYRRLSFDIDASAIVNHTPSFPVAGTTWAGTGFGSSLGIWFHPAQTFNAVYEPTGAGRRGAMTGLSDALDGFLDGANFTTATIPAPSAGVLISGALLWGARRRRA